MDDMEFWGVEVKGGEPLVVKSGDFFVHVSQAALGEGKKDKANESVYLYVKFGDKKLVLGTLSAEKFPQISFDLVFEREFELSHNWKNGSVYFTGYKFHTEKTDDGSEFNSDIEMVPAVANHGKPESQAAAEKVNTGKPGSSEGKQKVKIVEPSKDVDEETDDSSDDEDDSSSDDDSSDDQAVMGSIEAQGVDESDEEDDESDDEDEETEEEDEETPKAEPSKKRSAKSATKTPIPEKKAKLVTPQKSDGKKVVGHVATPYPSKKALKTSANSDQKKEQTPKAFTCKSCSRSFGSENALQSHTKDKHGAAK